MCWIDDDDEKVRVVVVKRRERNEVEIRFDEIYGSVDNRMKI